MTDHRDELIRVRDCETHILRGGAGPTLLSLHGAGGAPGWTPFMDALAQSFDVIAPEHPGFGRTDRPRWLQSVSDIAYFYLDFIDSLGLDHVHVVGNSLGGWVAAEMGIRSTRKIASMTLIAPVGIEIGEITRADMFTMTPEDQARIAFHDKKFGQMFLQHRAAEDQAKKNFATMELIGKKPYLSNPQLQYWLHRIDVPTQVLWGENDEVIPKGYAQPFLREISNATFIAIPHCGHLPHIEKRQEVVQAITSFARAHSSSEDSRKARVRQAV